MNDAAPVPTVGAAGNPPAVALGESWPWGIFLIAMLLLLYFVAIDEGAASAIPGVNLHEWVHDGRHLLAFPCH